MQIINNIKSSIISKPVMVKLSEYKEEKNESKSVIEEPVKVIKLSEKETKELFDLFPPFNEGAEPTNFNFRPPTKKIPKAGVTVELKLPDSLPPTDIKPLESPTTKQTAVTTPTTKEPEKQKEKDNSKSGCRPS